MSDVMKLNNKCCHVIRIIIYLPPLDRQYASSQIDCFNINMSHVMRKPVLPYANNKGADQPVHPRSLISTFIVRCLDSIIPLLAIAKIQDPS